MASTKVRDIAATLRDRIRDGSYAPGARIPPHRELLREFAVSPVTLQRAIDRLTGQGFLVARGNTGTFVTAHPPDRSCCALVVPKADDGRPTNRFWTTLLAAASEWSDAEGRHFTSFLIDGDDANYRQLCERVQDRAVAGVLFATTPHLFLESPLLTTPIPRVAIGEQPPDWDATRYNASFITPRADDLLETVFAGFVAAGRRRLGAIINQQIPELIPGGLATARKLGLETHPAWWLGLPIEPFGAATARAVARLLCTAREAERPDCILITDDNLVPAATAGILDAGLRMPEDVLVMAHANFPHPVPAAAPCQRYGYDAHQILSTAWAELIRLRDGAPRRAVVVPPTFT